MKRTIKLLSLTFFLFSITWSGCSKNFSPFKVVHSSTNTQEWVSMGADSVHFEKIKISGDYLYGFSINQGLYRIRKYNTNDWVFLGLAGLKGFNKFGLSDFAVFNSTIIAAGTGRMYRSTDNGATWDSTSFMGYSFLKLLYFSGHRVKHFLYYTTQRRCPIDKKKEKNLYQRVQTGSYPAF